MAFGASGHAKRSPETPPARPPTLPSDDDYRTGLKWSLIFHGAIIVVFLLFSVVFPGKPTPWVPTLRVDVVGLPEVLKRNRDSQNARQIKEILKKAEEEAKRVKPKKLPPLPKPTEIAKPDEMVLHPKQQPERQNDKKMSRHRESELLAKLRMMQALEKNQSEIHQTQYKGNKISKGTSLSGDARESDQSNYYDSVLERLRENWALPTYLAREELSAKVQIYIDAQGRLHDYRFVKLSGNPRFDDAVKRALEQSDPFPTPPSDLSANVLVNGIIFGFPL